MADRDRAALLDGRLLMVEGRGERKDRHAEVPIIHLGAHHLIDRSDLLEGMAAIDGHEGGAWSERNLGPPDEVRRPDQESHRVKMRRRGFFGSGR